MAGCPTGRPVAGRVLPRRLYPARTDQCHRLHQQGRDLPPSVRGGGGNTADHRDRSQTSGRTNRRNAGAAYLGFGADAPSARPWHRTWRRHFSGRGTLDSLPPWVLPARARPLPIVPSALHRGTGEASSLRATPVLWRARAPDRYRYIQALVGNATEMRVGGVCQAAIRGSRGCAGLPIALYAPRGDLEPTTGGHGRNGRDLPLEGLPGQRTYQA